MTQVCVIGRGWGATALLGAHDDILTAVQQQLLGADGIIEQPLPLFDYGKPIHDGMTLHQLGLAAHSRITLHIPQLGLVGGSRVSACT